MPPKHGPEPPATSRRDELANVVTHACGLLLSLAGVPFLVVLAARHGDA